MLVLDDEAGARQRSPHALHERLEQLGVYQREARPWLPHVTVLRFRERPRLRPPLPELGSFVRPTPLLTFPSAPVRGAVRGPRIVSR